MRTWRSISLTRRCFLIGWAVVVVFIAGWIWSPLFVLARIGLLGWCVGIVADLYTLFVRRTGLVAERRTLERWSNGDMNPVSLVLKSGYGMAMQVRVLDELPEQFQKRDLVLRGTLPAWGERTFDYTVRPVSRGVYRYGAIQAFVGGPLGMVERRFSLDRAREVAVYPGYLQMRKYELLAFSDRLTLAGVKRVRRIAHQAEFERIREYVTGDDRRTVNWKASARRGRLMVNQYQDERAQQVFSLIDTGRVMKMPFEGLSLLDHAINASLVISNIAMYKEDKAGVITFSDKVQEILPAGRQRGQLQRILQAYHALATDHMETDMEALFIAVKRHIHQRSLLLLFTNYESLLALQRQLPYLQRLARQHLVVPIFFLNTEVEKDLATRPQDTEQVYVHTIAEGTMHEKRLIARELERHGMPAILCRPQDLTVHVINRYLELKARGAL
ncbi:MAG: DUF58 domain-containing protein [Flavobacteriales bacterium]